MGLIAELQVRTYHESQGKPTYTVRKLVNVQPQNGHNHDLGLSSRRED
jgi:hypothetical protein